MKQAYLRVSAILLVGISFSAMAQKKMTPEQELAKKKKEMLTLSNGKYPETYPNKRYERIGAVIIDTKTRKVVRLLNDTKANKGKDEPEVTGRWLSVDPLATKYPSLSPYSFVANSPLILIDPDGEKIIVGKQDQSRFMEDMGKVFGENAQNMFSFNDKNELVINSVVLTNKDKQTVLEGMQTIVNQDDITRIVYVDQPGKAYHPDTRNYEGDVLNRGGEITVTKKDNPGRAENTIYVYGEGNPDGGKVQIIVGEPVRDPEKENIIGMDLKTKEATIDPRANNVIHGVGHVLNQGEDEQGKVIDFDNAGRRATNSTSGTTTISERPYDDEHKASVPK